MLGLSMNKAKTFISDRASIPLVLATVKSRFLQGNPVRNILIETGRKPLLERLLRKISQVEFCPRDLGDYANDDGIHLFHDRERYLLESYEHAVAQLDLGDVEKYLPGTRGRDNFSIFLSRYLIHEFANHYAASLLTAYYALEKEDSTDRVFMEYHRASRDLKFKFSSEMRIKLYRSTASVLPDFKNLARLLRLRLQVLLAGIGADSQMGKKPAKLAVQYVSGPNDRGYGSDFDWFEYSGLDYEDVIYVLENAGKHQVPDLSHQTGKGLDVVDVASHAFDLSRPETQADIRGAMRACWTAFFQCKGSLREKIRLAAATAFYGAVITRWLDFYNAYNILGYVNVADANLDALPKTHALEHLGGVDLSYEFSATGYHSLMDSKPIAWHQYLGWGPVSEEMIGRCDQAVPYRLAPQEITAAGNMKLFLQDRLLPAQIDVNQAIEAHKATRKILIMDSAATHLKFMSQSKIDNFYDAVFALVENRPEDLFIIKPQRAMQLRADQAERLQHLQDNDQIMIVPHFGLFHYLLPVIDLVIGMPIYASCIMESFAAGKPAICFDQMNWPHVMLEELPPALLVDDAPGLARAVDLVLANDIDIEPLCRRIEPYGDGKGHERFGHYLGLWTKHIQKEGDADKALEGVLKNYNDKWPLPIDRR